MCGFVGKITFSELDKELLEESNKYLICRGPDSTNFHHFSDKNLNISLAFNRLKIVDLSDKANQPMHLNDNSASIVFNGEIFNHKQLREELKNNGINFTTTNSDTEVLLNGIKYYGINFVNKLRGQFAFCYFDQKIKKAYLVSDRLNQKPLYYTFSKKSFTFSSNLKSLVKNLNTYNLDNQYIYEYLNYGIVASPNTIFENIKKLQPAQIIEIDYSRDIISNTFRIYWEPKNYIESKAFDENLFFEKFDEAVMLRTEADVPVANFLSGGIDSTSIIKNMHDKNNEVNSFSVVFNEKKYSEQKWSRVVSKKYSTNHKEVNASIDFDEEKISNALESLDEPYSDPSVIPSYLISKEISNYFKVAISGDGGDELLGGYKRLEIALKNKNIFSQFLSKGYKYYPPFLGTGNFFLSKSKDLNLSYESFFKDEKLFNLLKLQENIVKNKVNLKKDIDQYKAILLQDYKYYLPEMMMFKIDRTSMANSLEIRSPFVDHKLIEYVLSTQLGKNNETRNKAVLKRYLLKDFSEEFVNRKKQGFVFDLENWVYSNLSYINDYLTSGSYFQNFPKNTIKLLSIYKSRINANRIWRLFVLEHYLAEL